MRTAKIGSDDLRLYSEHSENRDHKMRQAVAYKRLKTMKNHKPSGPKSGKVVFIYARCYKFIRHIILKKIKNLNYIYWVSLNTVLKLFN